MSTITGTRNALTRIPARTLLRRDRPDDHLAPRSGRHRHLGPVQCPVDQAEHFRVVEHFRIFDPTGEQPDISHHVAAPPQ